MKTSYQQRGAVLIVSLIILLVITLIGISGVRGGVLGLQVASNEEERLLALQTAQAGLDVISENPANFIVNNENLNAVIKCDPNQTCQDNTLSLTNPALTAIGSATVRRIAPGVGTPPRLPGYEFSARSFRAVFFQVDVETNQVGDAHGYAGLSQGYMRLIINE